MSKKLHIKLPLTDGNNANYNLNLPDSTSWTANRTIATTSDIKNGTLTIQSNGVTLGTFSANQNTNATIDLKTAEVIDVSNGVTQAIKDKVTDNHAILLKYGEYIYVPQYTPQGDSLPTYYNCFEGDSHTFHYLEID